MVRVESLLSARLFGAPQIVGHRIFFLSNLSGHISLYVMDSGGSVPEPLLPPHIALPSPGHAGGLSFYVFPRLNKILVMIDHNGDENFQPMVIPIDGGFPEPAFGARFTDHRVFLAYADPEHDLVYFTTDLFKAKVNQAFRANLTTGETELLGESRWGTLVSTVSADHTQVILIDAFTFGDHLLYRWTTEHPERTLLYGTPLDLRAEGEIYPINGLFACEFTPGNRGLLMGTALFNDAYGLGYLDLADPTQIDEVSITGVVHEGVGELAALRLVRDNRYTLEYNIDGASWVYAGVFDEARRTFNIEHVLCGQGLLANGVIGSLYYDKVGDQFAFSFSTATTPTQLYTIDRQDPSRLIMHTRERLLGLPETHLSAGEDASFSSHDGERISARLYLPAEALGYQGPRPLVYYIHGGPQSQERPDFSWFSMPLIQFLTLNGFAVFVPNVRGSVGYGLRYMKQVDNDWGGKDRLDHVHAMSLLANDPRIDTARAGVTGRSYGGYMTLTLASRHPELWSAAVDMFGPYDLSLFMERVPETWKPYFALAVGDPIKDHDFLVERSPRSYTHQITCPLLVIQGKNDPRVIEQESLDVVEQLRELGKQAEYLVFDNEGHDVLRYENRVTCYNAINEFFRRYLKP